MLLCHPGALLRSQLHHLLPPNWSYYPQTPPSPFLLLLPEIPFKSIHFFALIKTLVAPYHPQNYKTIHALVPTTLSCLCLPSCALCSPHAEFLNNLFTCNRYSYSCMDESPSHPRLWEISQPFQDPAQILS